MRNTMMSVLGLIAVVGSARVAVAQPETTMAVELRPFVGVFIPTGAQRNDFKTASTVGFQGAIEVSSHVHMLVSGSWTHGHARFAPFPKDLTEIWQFDLGTEFNLARPLGAEWLLKPFIGAGPGVRTYDYQAPGMGTKACFSAYGAIGGEVQRRALALRLEARDFVSCFESPITGKKRTRNDLGISLGLAFHMM